MAGPGTELHKLLGRLGFRPKPGCKCIQRMKVMDKKGPNWCRHQLDTIISWMREEASRRHLPFNKSIAKALINRAIRKSLNGRPRKTQAASPAVLPTKSRDQSESKPKKVRWTYGVTTVPERLDNALPRTLQSLALAGFDKPRLFVDGAEFDHRYKNRFGLETTFHWPRIRTAGNWVLSLYELYIREPACNLYAVFQDDILVSQGLKEYLERCDYPVKGYWSLFTSPANQNLCPKDGQAGWYQANQMGKGALGLVFSRDVATTLLSSQHLVNRPQNIHRGHRSIDGGVVTALKKAGIKEYVHSPSPIQHQGVTSVMKHGKFAPAPSFRGEKFDLTTLLER